ncbi:hypothetical protein BGZ89_005765 [Linnemannia elongata]|nr:hypothetical protein BGZ89_005765 [Linnemannia elongata]
MTVPKRPSTTLQRSIIPIHYRLKIVPCPVNFSFLGECSIDVTATSVSYNVEEETITLEFPQVLHVGSSWILDITYIGLVNDKLNGFYRSVYTDADNNVQ